MRSSQQKGKRGEREVVAYWRLYGWDKAHRSPGSGALRPYGARDLSPYPCDVVGIAPFMCEVKYDERARKAGRGWPGQAFVKATLKDLQTTWFAHAGVVGSRHDPIPCAFVRGSFEDWTVWVPEWFCAIGWQVPEGAWQHPETPLAWAGLDVSQFFDLAQVVAPPDNQDLWPRPSVSGRPSTLEDWADLRASPQREHGGGEGLDGGHLEVVQVQPQGDTKP